MAADSVPDVYLDAWARLQCQRPRVPDDEWQLAINDADGFLDAWGRLAWGLLRRHSFARGFGRRDIRRVALLAASLVGVTVRMADYMREKGLSKDGKGNENE
jgi:hypothetical protein